MIHKQEFTFFGLILINLLGYIMLYISINCWRKKYIEEKDNITIYIKNYNFDFDNYFTYTSSVRRQVINEFINSQIKPFITRKKICLNFNDLPLVPSQLIKQVCEYLVIEEQLTKERIDDQIKFECEDDITVLPLVKSILQDCILQKENK